MGDVVVHELSPLHQHQRVLVRLGVLTADGGGADAPGAGEPGRAGLLHPVLVLGREQPLQRGVGPPPPRLIFIPCISGFTFVILTWPGLLQLPSCVLY